ncbi:MAG: hypothetical protein FJX23_00605 [Alphaproteobacteria bacterium]|nr:hypothetical protein [Alphaproteobacteria bacterium]
MSNLRIFFGNLGYGRGIDGSLAAHIRYAHRHVYCPRNVQELVIRQVADIIEKEDPDICCFVEIDSGSPISSNFNQMTALVNEKYSHFDIENKYGLKSWLRKTAFTRGKSNAFLAKQPFPHEKIYLHKGAKRLVYKVQLRKDLTLFFAHFSLNLAVRKQQLQQARQLMQACEGEVIFMGDFNILSGFAELNTLLDGGDLVLMNREDNPTFRFHTRASVLDLCICSRSLMDKADLRVIPQPYSDHAALLLDVRL